MRALFVASRERRHLAVAAAIVLSLAMPARGDATDSWTTVEPLPLARYSHEAVLLRDGRVLVVGGYTPDTWPPASYVFDPDARTWTGVGDPVGDRQLSAAALLNDGRVLLVGSWNSEPELFDPSTNAWSPTGPAVHRERNEPSVTVMGDGRVLVTGGLGEDGSAEIYDPETNVWSPAAPMAHGRASHGAALLHDGRVLVAGGGLNGGWAGSPASTSIEIFDPVTGMWAPPVSLVTSRDWGATRALTLDDGRVLIASGTLSGIADLYDPVTNISTATYQTTDRPFASMAKLHDGRIILTGSYHYPNPVSSTEVFDPVTNTWSPGPAMSVGRADHSTTALPEAGVLVVGGYRGELPATPSAELFLPARRETALDAAPAVARLRSGDELLGVHVMRLTARLRDHAASPMPGRRVTFLAGATTVCADTVTNQEGVAECPVGAAHQAVVGERGYRAVFAGSRLYASSWADASMLEVAGRPLP